MLSPGGRVADVGCDHGFLDIYLVQTGKLQGALAMDVRKGPLAAAAEHVREAGLSKLIETRISDGLEAFQVGEAQKLVCAGMGGPLMQRILTASPEKTEGFQEMILQPQSELMEFRAFLREQGYRIVEERIIFEDGKYYFPMKVVPHHDGDGIASSWQTAPGDMVDEGGSARKGADDGQADDMRTSIYDRYGELLIRGKDPLLMQYLKEQERILKEILENLKPQEGLQSENVCDAEALGNSKKTSAEDAKTTERNETIVQRMSGRERRLQEVRIEWELLHQAMELMK